MLSWHADLDDVASSLTSAEEVFARQDNPVAVLDPDDCAAAAGAAVLDFNGRIVGFSSGRFPFSGSGDDGVDLVGHELHGQLHQGRHNLCRDWASPSFRRERQGEQPEQQGNECEGLHTFLLGLVRPSMEAVTDRTTIRHGRNRHPCRRTGKLLPSLLHVACEKRLFLSGPARTNQPLRFEPLPRCSAGPDFSPVRLVAPCAAAAVLGTTENGTAIQALPLSFHGLLLTVSTSEPQQGQHARLPTATAIKFSSVRASRALPNGPRQ